MCTYILETGLVDSYKANGCNYLMVSGSYFLSHYTNGESAFRYGGLVGRVTKQ